MTVAEAKAKIREELLSVSVAILTRDRLPLLTQTIGGVLAQLSDSDEVRVLDTGSRDGTIAWLTDFSVREKRLRFETISPERVDFGAARNRLAAGAQGGLVAFIDDDCIPAADWLEQLRRAAVGYDAVGGVALFAEAHDLPWWWSAELGWTVGISGPGLFRGLFDHYPSTSNLAIRRDELLRFPFAETRHSFGAKGIYLGGREDAEWWKAARVRGAALGISTECAVAHAIPAERLGWRYVLRRAKTDGRAAAQRGEADEHGARSAAAESGAGVIDAALDALRMNSGSVQRAVARVVWSARQFSFAREGFARIKRDGATKRAVAYAARGAISSVRTHAGDGWFASVRRVTRAPLRMPEVPQRLFVAAPTFLGDTVMLQSAVRMLATTWPQARVTVWASYPAALGELPENVAVIPAPRPNHVASSDWVSAADGAEVVFAPYYHFGPEREWRTLLSLRGVTFDGDVGFRRRRDYTLAARIVRKDFLAPEIHNVVRLVSAWPLVGELLRPVLVPGVGAWDSLCRRNPKLAELPQFAALQLDSGLPYKKWPLERWGVLARDWFDATGIPLVIHRPPGQTAEAVAFIEKLGLPEGAIIVADPDLPELIALIARAKIAIGADSGPKHIAFAVDTPTFTLYGPTGADRWGALWDVERHDWIRSPVGELSAREHHGLVFNHSMMALEAEKAVEALLRHARSLGLLR